MTASHTSSFCNRAPTGHEQLLRQTPFDDDERHCLDIARLFFSTFATPLNHNWIRAFEFADHVFDHQSGPGKTVLILKLIQSIRLSRTSVFTFSNPDCPGCARILTEHERRLITAIAKTRRGNMENARIEMMMLCEGNDIEPVMAWLSELALALPILCGAQDAHGPARAERHT